MFGWNSETGFRRKIRKDKYRTAMPKGTTGSALVRPDPGCHGKRSEFVQIFDLVAEAVNGCWPYGHIK